MTKIELEALAEYRKHKRCGCPNCQLARKVLSDMDRCKWAPKSVVIEG